LEQIGFDQGGTPPYTTPCLVTIRGTGDRRFKKSAEQPS
jgi:hypothetical protein